MQERRQAQRISFTETVHYAVSVLDVREMKVLNLKATAVDINGTGVGIKTDYPLGPGHVLRFYDGIKHKVGLVKWCMPVNQNSTYRVGVKFV